MCSKLLPRCSSGAVCLHHDTLAMNLALRPLALRRLQVQARMGVAWKFHFKTCRCQGNPWVYQLSLRPKLNTWIQSDLLWISDFSVSR